MNILIFGSGAREHAISKSISKSKIPTKIYHADAGFAIYGEIIEYENFEDLASKCFEIGINLVIIGPEKPLCEGIVDAFKAHNITCIGVDKKFSQLESSKLYAKKFMEKHGIKTAAYTVVEGKKLPNFETLKYPIAIKADGLCGGKGVVIANNVAFAEKTVKEYLDGKFGEESKTVLLEEFLEGSEVSLMSLFDGKNLLDLVPTKDFKKLNKSPGAPNTGGMGAYCPVKMTRDQRKKLNEYKTKLKNALIAEKADFCGFIYSGLIWAFSEWHVLEYNVRLGDPETQAILTHLKTDFLSILVAATKQELNDLKLEYKHGYSACLVIATQGYPKAPKDGERVEFETPYGLKVYYAGMRKIDGEIVSHGGRILSLCTTSNTPFDVLKHFAKKIKMKNKYYRDDLEIK